MYHTVFTYGESNSLHGLRVQLQDQHLIIHGHHRCCHGLRFQATSVLVNVIYWLVDGNTQILEFEMHTNSLLKIRTLLDIPNFIIFLMRDGQLGYAGMMGPIVTVFNIEDVYEDGYDT